MFEDRLDPALRQFAGGFPAALVQRITHDAEHARRQVGAGRGGRPWHGGAGGVPVAAPAGVRRSADAPSKEEFITTPGFDGPAVTQMWQHYLAGEAVPADAVPAHTDELAGVASTLITCSELDPLRDEAVDYAMRLMWAGVATELHVFPGTCHGFDSLLPEWETSRQLFDLQGAALRRALHHAASWRAIAAW
jgi:acetyl esterase/lipase